LCCNNLALLYQRRGQKHLARMFFHRGENACAVSAADECIVVAPASPQVLFHAACAYSRAVDAVRADARLPAEDR
jgi:hypothetical protein